MAGLQRFITYIYKYEDDKKMENAGFAKVEIRNGICRMEVHLRNISTERPNATVYLFAEKAELIRGIPVGSVSIAKGVGDARYAFETKELAGYGMAMDGMDGIYVPLDGSQYLASQWNEGTVENKRFLIMEKEEAKREKEAPKDMEAERASKRPGESAETVRQNAQRSETHRQEGRQAEMQQQNAQRPEMQRQNAQRPEMQQQNAQRPETQQQKAQRSETQRQNAQRPETQRQNAQQAEAHRQEGRQAEMQQQNAQQTEAQRQEMQQQKAQQAEAQRQETQQQKAQQAEAQRQEGRQAEMQQQKAQQTERSFEHAEDGTETQPIHTTELPLEEFQGEMNWEKIFQKLRMKLELFFPFEGREIECVRMQLKDLQELPRRYWYIGNNSFLLHGFFNYRHILFGEMRENGKKTYLIGVPGVFQNQERIMAAMFGFPEFCTAKTTDYKTGNFGYWYRMI